MATYALIHGAGDVGWYWHVVERVLRERGHRTVAPDLPIEDPSIPTYLVLCRDDRFFPAAWLRNVVRARLRIEPDELGSGRTPALSHPTELVDLMESYRESDATSVQRTVP